MKTKQILIGAAVLGVAFFFYTKSKSKKAEPTTTPTTDEINSKAINSQMEESATKESEKSKAAPIKSNIPPTAKNSVSRGNAKYAIVSKNVKKISDLRDTKLGERLREIRIKSGTETNETVSRNLQNFLDKLSREDRKLFGYLVYLDEKRITSGEFPSAIERVEGTGAFEKVIDLGRNFNRIAEGLGTMTEGEGFAFSFTSDKLSSENEIFAFNGHTF